MKDMTQGKISATIIRFSLPLFFGGILQQLFNVVDGIIVGQFVGKEAMAAVGVSFPIMFLLVALVIGATMGMTVLISQYYGAKNYAKVKRTIDTGAMLLLWMVIVVTAAGVFGGGWLLRAMNTPGDIFFLAHDYIRIMFLGMFTMFGYNGLSAILRGLGDSKTPLYLLVLATVVNIALDLVFVLVLGWGVNGVAIATVIAQGTAFFVGLIVLARKSEFFRFRMRDMRLDWDILKKSLRIGMPSGIQQVMVAVGSMAVVGLVNRFGTDAMAAFTVAGRIESFAMMPAMNMSMAISTFVGQNVGAGQHERVKQGVRLTFVMGIVIAVAVSALILFFSSALMAVFNRDPQVVRMGAEYMYIVAPFYIAFVTMFVFNGALRGAGDVVVPMVVTIFALWGLRIPVSVVFSRLWGINGIWWGIPAAWIFGMVASMVYFFSGKWKQKTTAHSVHLSGEAAEAAVALECEGHERKECIHNS